MTIATGCTRPFSECGHEGCDGQECCDAQFLLTAPDGTLVHDCAICCREIVSGERPDDLRTVAKPFHLMALLCGASLLDLAS